MTALTEIVSRTLLSQIWVLLIELSTVFCYFQGGSDTVCVFILSTYTDGEPPEGAAWFCRWLRDAAVDFRVSKSTLARMNYVVVGLGNSLYADNFCTVNMLSG